DGLSLCLVASWNSHAEAISVLTTTNPVNPWAKFNNRCLLRAVGEILPSAVTERLSLIMSLRRLLSPQSTCGRRGSSTKNRKFQTLTRNLSTLLLVLHAPTDTESWQLLLY